MPRVLTIALALCLILLTLPLMIAVALGLLADGMRPVLYAGLRVGRHGRRFWMIKFRTLRPDPRAPGDHTAGGYQASLTTRYGRFLRRSRLDELPQLFNVLTGDLDLVGYRPPLPSYVERYPSLYAPLLGHRPGITGLASVLFHQREDRTLATARSAEEAQDLHARICIPAKARLDRFYQTHRSTLLDMRILLMTLRRLAPRGGGDAGQRLAHPGLGGVSSRDVSKQT